jgi:hypothetical protein
MKKLLLVILLSSNVNAANTSNNDPLYYIDGLNYFDDLQMQDVYNNYNSVINTNAKVLVLDNGYQVNHEDAGHTNSSLISQAEQHGTLVAGLIYAKIGNEKGYRGLVAPTVADFKKYADGCKSLTKRSKGRALCKKNALHEQIQGFDIINLSQHLSEWSYQSYRLQSSDPSYSEYQSNWFPTHLEHMKLFRDVMNDNSNKLFILAAGNNSIPALYENGAIHVDNYRMNQLSNVIVVGAYNGSSGNEYLKYDYGSGIDLIARTGISGPTYTKNSTGGYSLNNSENGTSFSAPQVTGVAAMMFDVCSKMQGYSISSIKSSMENANFDTLTKTHGSKTYNYKILNAYKAVKKAHDICN